MKNFLRNLLLFFSAAVLIISCKQDEETVHVRVIATADVHAVIFPYDFVNDVPMNGSLAHVSTFVNQERANRDQHLILLDNGDLLQGQPTGYFANFIADEDENLFSRVMNYIGFDAATVGNHDIEMGAAVYNQLKNEFNFPWLAANILDRKTGLPYFQPYHIMEKDGIRIAILGLITPTVPNWLPAKLWEGLEFTGMYEAAVEWMEYIRDHEKPHAIIGLFHSGAGDGYDVSVPDHQMENASLFVAKNVPGFNVVFTAHDHRIRNKYVENTDGQQVLVIAGQSFGRSLAVADLHFRKNAQGDYFLAEHKGHIAEMAEIRPDEQFLSYFEPEYQQVREFVEKEIGTLEGDLHSRDAYSGNSAFVDLIHTIQLELTGARISFAAPLSFNATLEKGPLTMRDMFRLYPFENYLYVMELTGNEIRDFLEYSYGLWYSTMEDETDHLMLLRKDDNGQLVTDQQGRARFANAFYNFDSAFGIDYEVDVTKPVGNRVTIKGLSGGGTFVLSRTYRVAINSYRGSGGGGHLTQGAGIDHADLPERIIWTSERDLRSYLADYIQQVGTLNPKPASNWRVVPEQWARIAAERDYQLLFGL